jgi:hypothetical protein
MDIRNIARWLKNPSEMDENSLTSLELMCREYPYFQLPAILYLKNLSVLGRSYSKELEDKAIQIADRKRLLQFIAGKPLSNFPFTGKTEKDKKNETLSEPEIPIAKNIIAPEKLLKPEHHNLSDDILILEENQGEDYQFEAPENQLEESIPPVEVQKKRKKINLGSEVLNEEYNPDEQSDDPIDRFLTNMPGPIRINEEEPIEKPVVEINSEPETEEIASEPLARIYAMQGLTDKAISIYEKLRLKYPEKSAYFAVQIENLHNKIK